MTLARTLPDGEGATARRHTTSGDGMSPPSTIKEIFLSAADVARILGCSKSYAYEVMREMPHIEPVAHSLPRRPFSL